jgi:serine/threonine-protein kinase
MRKRIVTIGLLFLCTATLMLAQRTTGDDLFQKGLDQERGKRDIAAAVKIYEDILKQFPSNRALMARTLAQLGDCYEKLGQEKAQQYYQQVIAKYPEQADMVAKAKTHLANLTGIPISPVPAAPVEFGLPQGTNLAHAFRTGLDISPDGKRIAFVASPSLDSRFGANLNRTIYVKSTDDFGQTKPVPGTENGYNPFFSPDGEWLGFFSGSPRVPDGPETIEIKKVRLSGGSPFLLANVTIDPNQYPDNVGATWGANGTIVIGSLQDGLKWIPEDGGQPQLFTHLDAAADEVSHRLPHFLPDGSGVLFTVLRGSPDFITNPQIWVTTKTGKPKLLQENGTDARVGNNRLFFARDGKLFAVAFDPKTLSTSGAAVPAIEDGVVHSISFDGAGTSTGAAQYSVSQNGSLLYAQGSTAGENRSVAWIDEKRVVTPLGIQPREYLYARVSPDGRYILLTARDGLWLYDTVQNSLQNQTGISSISTPAEWAPDGTRFAFGIIQGAIGTYLKELASANIKRVESGYSAPVWTSERELVVLRSTSGKFSIHVSPLDQPDHIRPLLQNAMYNYAFPAISPDGRWLAYCSDESGNYEVYVQPYPGPGPRVQISPKEFVVRYTSGPGLQRFGVPHTEPAWSQDGRLFYSIPNSRIMSLKYKVSNGEFIPEIPVALLPARPASLSQFYSTAGVRSWDVAPDGRLVVIQQESGDSAQERQRKTHPSTLVLMAPSTQRITLGPGASPSPGASGQESQLLWVDRDGTRRQQATPVGEYVMPELSPDGKWLAFSRGTPSNSWIMELGTGRLEEITKGNKGDWSHPRWSPDGKMIAVLRTQNGDIHVAPLVQPEQSPYQLMFRTNAVSLSDWSPDGRYLVYISNFHVFALPISADLKPGEPLQITTTPFAESDARVSSDGHWIAYVSNERGRNVIYVQSFPEGGVKQLVSKEGGIQPRWTDGGSQLMYFEPSALTGRFLAVSIKTAAGQLEIGMPQAVGPAPNSDGSLSITSFTVSRRYTYNVSPDGRLLIQCGTPRCQSGR